MDTTKAITLNADEMAPRQLNAKLRELMAAGENVVVENPRSRHNLGVALPGPGHGTFKGSVGYYCGGLSNGGSVEIAGNAGWGIGESMAKGFIRVLGSVGHGVGASLRGGRIVVEGYAWPRAGVAQKGGTVVVGGSIGFLSGFMAQRGKLIALGDASDGVGDSLYEGNIFVAGRIHGLGIDAVIAKPAAEEIDEIESIIAEVGLRLAMRDWKKVVAG